jgi:hypothetical protein
MMDEEIRQALTEVREMKQMCGNINMKLTNIVTQRGQDFKKKLEAEYQRGFEDGKAIYEKGCEGCKYGGSLQGSSPCYNCSNCYKNNWTAKDDKIEVGDEVNWLGTCFIVTRIFQPYNMKEQCDGIDDDGCVYSYVLIDDLEKTGRHFDIAKILEDMRND